MLQDLPPMELTNNHSNQRALNPSADPGSLWFVRFSCHGQPCQLGCWLAGCAALACCTVFLPVFLALIFLVLFVLSIRLYRQLKPRGGCPKPFALSPGCGSCGGHAKSATSEGPDRVETSSDRRGTRGGRVSCVAGCGGGRGRGTGRAAGKGCGRPGGPGRTERRARREARQPDGRSSGRE